MQYTHRKKLVLYIGKKDSRTFGMYLFPIFNMFSFISAFIIDIRAGVLSGLVIAIFTVAIYPECLRCFKDASFTLFYLVNLFSVFAYTFNGRPIQIYLSCITYNLIPMLMYGVGYVSDIDENNNPVLKGAIISNIFIVLVGFIIYFSPGIAVRVGMDSIETAGINSAGVGYRFGSYLDSLMLGNICAVSIPLLLMYQFKRNFLKPVFLVLFSVALFLTMQRGAWVVGVIGAVMCLFVSTVIKRKGIKSFILYLLGSIIVAFSLYYFVNNLMSAGFLKHLQIRLNKFSLDTMVSSRSYQMDNGIETFLNYPFGFGLGAAGNKASRYHMQIVPDGNWIRILVETGLLGIISFVILNCKAVIRGIKNQQFFSVIVVIVFLTHAIGSNVLDFYYGSFIYWYILGFLNKNGKHKKQ